MLMLAIGVAVGPCGRLAGWNRFPLRKKTHHVSIDCCGRGVVVGPARRGACRTGVAGNRGLIERAVMAGVRFDGADYVPARDDARLSSQLIRILALMTDQQWRTLASIAAATGAPQASVSAQLRHLRKPRFGRYRVERQHRGQGLYVYRVLPPVPVDRLF